MTQHPDNSFDAAVIDGIRKYIKDNDLSLGKIAEETGIKYICLYQMLNRNQSIRLSDYIAICRAFDEPIDTFLP